jgi:uncharacterized membrane protein HdeD (DUF308 family)
MLGANWRALALRGLVALLFGLVVLFWPSLVLTVLALLFGIYAVVDGAITFIPATAGGIRRDKDHRLGTARRPPRCVV